MKKYERLVKATQDMARWAGEDSELLLLADRPWLDELLGRFVDRCEDGTEVYNLKFNFPWSVLKAIETPLVQYPVLVDVANERVLELRDE